MPFKGEESIPLTYKEKSPAYFCAGLGWWFLFKKEDG
jgi:hypothetical protein